MRINEEIVFRVYHMSLHTSWSIYVEVKMSLCFFVYKIRVIKEYCIKNIIALAFSSAQMNQWNAFAFATTPLTMRISGLWAVGAGM